MGDAMVMSENTLATELQNLTATDDEATAIQRLVDAYGVFASDAESNAVSITPAGVELGKTAMAAALVGMSAPGAGIVSIPASVIAFWGGVASGLATSFPGATAITPPPHASLSSTFAALMPANIAANLSLKDATAAIASIMYADAIVGGTATFPGPVTAPIE